MKRLNKTESEIFISLFWFGSSRGIDFYQNVYMRYSRQRNSLLPWIKGMYFTFKFIPNGSFKSKVELRSENCDTVLCDQEYNERSRKFEIHAHLIRHYLILDSHRIFIVSKLKPLHNDLFLAINFVFLL